MRMGKRVQGREFGEARTGGARDWTASAEEDAMIRLQDISYVRLGTADLEGATKFRD